MSSFNLIVSEIAYLMEDRGFGTREECVRAALEEIKKGSDGCSEQFIKDMESAIKILEGKI